MNASAIQAISVHLEADEKIRLFVMVARDGSINRMGSGKLQEQNETLYTGITDPSVFEQLLEAVPAQLLEKTNLLEDPEAEGMPCRLNISLAAAGDTLTTEYRYGSRSVGPPDELVSFTHTAIRLTEQWFLAQH